ncbi:hypothetical protein FQN50_006399 [Emmonsiellopsis sp. PD_5]|nr:hypothetical protein FQN50_006399 [Emmonsiellopsis sp. PD_5]
MTRTQTPGDEDATSPAKQAPEIPQSQQLTPPPLLTFKSLLGTRDRTLRKYGVTPGITPFPAWPSPSPEQCEEVNRLLTSVHGELKQPEIIPMPSLEVVTCGEVPSVLDALLRTVISSAVTVSSAANALKGLVEKFGVQQHGIGRGSVDWNNVRQAPVDEVGQAMRSSGLGRVKSTNIKAILDMVYNDNKKMRAEMRATAKKQGSGLDDMLSATHKVKEEGEITTGDCNYDTTEADLLSLEHLRDLSTDDAMAHLLVYPGIGIKIAACVLLFCLQRPCFAVDTHVFRLCRWLQWIPPDPTTTPESSIESDAVIRGNKKVTTDIAFTHLDARVPDHLKYSLHQLFFTHGRKCLKCAPGNVKGGDVGDGEDCVLETLLTREEDRRLAGKGKRKRKRDDEEVS